MGSSDVLDRRRFLLGAGGALVALSAGCSNPFSQAQPPRVYRIGFLALFPQPYDDALFQRLRELGYVEGQNLTVERRYAEGTERLQDLADELVRLQPDVLVAVSTPAVSAAQQATREIPIVMPFSGDPVRQGFVAALGRPGGNITGLSSLSVTTISGKRLELLKESSPTIRRVAALWNPDNQAKALELKALEDADGTLGLELDGWPVRSRDELHAAFTAIPQRRPDALAVLHDALTGGHQAEIAGFATRQGLPAISELREFAESGLLMTYGPDTADLLRRSAEYVDKILKGVRPADLPVEQPTRFDFALNMKTAQALGLTIPHHVLLQVTEVIE